VDAVDDDVRHRVFSGHAAAWSDLWSSEIQVGGQPELQDWVRANLYALWSSIRAGADDSISPVGLSSDNYAGLIFWDAETWMYPSLLAMHPDAARSILEYRRKTLPGARSNAVQLGYQGIFYPWNGAGTGDLWQECHSWNPPHCITQIHLQGDIALAAWQYYLATGDEAALRQNWTMLHRDRAEYTTVRLRGGAAAPVDTPAGTRTLSSSLSIPTRRPDLAPTTDAARCKPATATSEEAGMYAEAAVDGSAATIWAPTATTASLLSDLGARTRITDVTVDWTDQRPLSYRIETSLDGDKWSPMTNATYARYVRVTLTRDPDAPRTGIRELVATTK
jgi:hypothetical protein